MQAKPPKTLEIVHFNAMAGNTDAEMVAAVSEGRDWLARQPGFVARHLCRQGDAYADLVIWADMASAQAAAAQVMTEPAFAGFMALIDGPSVRMDHLPILVSMP